MNNSNIPPRIAEAIDRAFPEGAYSPCYEVLAEQAEEHIAKFRQSHSADNLISAITKLIFLYELDKSNSGVDDRPANAHVESSALDWSGVRG